ncbi:hypothetical protein GCK32_019920 [Trichostrongylus colubriformis]|uniref:Uncharacterized protein n=1 Tax=Trichostrongylus colubriformis TaxID=6319 RepID=A0AAN8FWF5_TRICO
MRALSGYGVDIKRLLRCLHASSPIAKKLLPLYYVAIFLILVFCYLLLPISYQQTNLEKSKTALLLISNIKLSCFENNFSVMVQS